jgi:glucose-6-phosphate 1-dehydrogenase
MTSPTSDALVLFGATGDLAHRKIFPALQALVASGSLDVPVVGMARAGWQTAIEVDGDHSASPSGAASGIEVG